MSWKKHICITAAKANQTRLFLQRNLPKCSRAIKLQCYKTYVRPITEYACTVWSPHGNKSLTEKIERVQRKAARWIESKWKYTDSPTSMISNLRLASLESRRNAACIKMLFNIMNRNKYIHESCIPKRQRCSNIRFQPIYAALKSYEHSFFPSSIKLWNRLPLNIVNSVSPNDFKDELNKFYSL